MQKGFPLILIALAVALGGYFLYQQQTKSTPATPLIQTVAQPSPASNETANLDSPGASWKTYTNTEAKVSFQYPLDWAVKEEQPNEDYKRISMKGKEGEILLDYGAGFGGACPSGYENFNIGNAQTQACHSVPAKDDESETWSLSAMEKNNVNFNKINYSGFVTANAPYKDNRDLILKILSTFKFQ